jgi:cell growth-regulating nucleolar protein
MVDDDQPNTPKIMFSTAKEREAKEMAMKSNAPPLFNDSRSSSRNGHRNSEDQLHSEDYAQNGFSYGSEAINPKAMQDVNGSYISLDFMTPAAKAARLKLDGKAVITPAHSRTNSGSEKKRKRGSTADGEGDVPMGGTDTHVTIVDTPGIAHSGLTGGLQRMITDDSGFYPQPSSDNEKRTRPKDERRKSRHTEDPPSPLKRSKHTKERPEKKDDSGLGISLKGRAAKALSMVGGALMLPSQAQDLQNIKTRRRASSSDHYARPELREASGEKRERKKHKVERHNGTSSHNTRPHHKGSSESPQRRQKTIEYHKRHDDSGSDSDGDAGQNGNGDVVVFGAEEKQKRQCESFLGNIPRIGESEKGYSVHKALKRWHKQGDHRGSERGPKEEDLWRGLRLRKNERGEVVVFWGGLMGD